MKPALPLFIAILSAGALFSGCQTAPQTPPEPQMGEIWTQPGTDAEQAQHRAHYYFAHRALPFEIYNDPELVASELNNRGVDYLKGIWGSMVDTAPSYVMDHQEDLELTVENGPNDSTIYFITFPEPKFFPEAYYAAFIFPAPADSLSYYTLEKSVLVREPESETQMAVLGGWDGPQHFNFGSAELIDGEEFKELVREIASGEQPLQVYGGYNAETRTISIGE